jgi:nucleotide sugar dehydrogenase
MSTIKANDANNGNGNGKKVAVFGLGFVGLPLALSFAMRGCEVVGVDVDDSLVAALNNGSTHHREWYHRTPIQKILQDQLENGRFRATGDAGEALACCRNVIVTVGLPVVDGQHSLEYLESACNAIAAGLKPGDLILIRSTVVPGTTRGFILPLLEKSGLKAGRDFHLAYSSERIAEGKAFDEFENMPTVVGGIDKASRDRAMELLGIVTRAELVPATSIEVVETAKVMENISRDVDIAMVNEFARFTKALGIDIFETIRITNTHKRVKLLLPGPGVGGYCIPNALHYLAPKADELGVPLSLLRTARRVNADVPAYVAGLVLKNLPVPAADAKVAVFGFAMKDYSNDDRQSPALDVIAILRRAGIKVAAYDPAVPCDYDFTVSTFEEALARAHGIAVLAKQEDVDYFNFKQFKKLMNPTTKPFIVDTRNIYDREKAEKAGFTLETI